MNLRLRAADALAGLRPQPFGSAHPSTIRDPIVEPMWTGVRALVALDGSEVRLQDGEGVPVDDVPEVGAALAAAARADGLILDGFLTKETSHDTVGADAALEDAPSMGTFMTQSLLGTRRNPRKEVIERTELVEEAGRFDEDDEVGFVALDLLWLDGESLLDVPLLERKRLLETVLVESETVRLGVYVRHPIDTWVASWRALGFLGLTFRAANSRYFPGEKRKDWTTAWMPRR